jgi:hypothetical protein
MQAFFGEVTLPVNLSPLPLRIVTEVLTGVAALTSAAAITATSTIPIATTALRRFN